jgi:hypothetical protein
MKPAEGVFTRLIAHLPLVRTCQGFSQVYAVLRS